MRLKPEQKLIAIILGCSLLIIIIGAIIIAPTIFQILTVRNDLFKLREALEQKNRQATQTRFTRERLADVEREAIAFQESLFTKNDELRLITLLEKTAERQAVDLKITNSNFGSLLGRPLELAIVASGNYNDILSFFTALEALPYFVTLQQVRLSADTNPTASRPLTIFEATLLLYVAS